MLTCQITFLLQVLCPSTDGSSKEDVPEIKSIGSSQESEEFEHVHCVVLSSLALAIAPQLQIDAAIVLSSLQETLDRSQASSHILIQKAADKAIGIWQNKAAGKRWRQQNCAKSLEQFLFLLPL